MTLICDKMLFDCVMIHLRPMMISMINLSWSNVRLFLVFLGVNEDLHSLFRIVYWDLLLIANQYHVCMYSFVDTSLRYLQDQY